MKKVMSLLSVCALLSYTHLSAQNPATIDASKTYQTIEGLGGFGSFSAGSTFSSNYFKQVIDNLGCTFFRHELSPDYVKTLDSLNSGLVLSTAGVFKTNVDFINTAKQKGTFRYIFTAWTPPAYLKSSKCHSQRVPKVAGGPLICGQACLFPICANSYNYQDTGNFLVPTYYDEYAKYLGLYAKGIKAATGTDIYAIGIQNEPMFNEPYNSALLYAPEFAACMKVVGPYFAGDGQLSGIKFYGAEHAFTYARNHGGDAGAWGGTESSKYIQYLMDSASTRQYMHAYATHGNVDGMIIDNGSSSDWSQYANATTPYGKKMWATEMYMNSTDWPAIFASAGGIQIALKYGQVSAWAYWVLSGELYTSELPDSRTAAVKQYFRFIRPGYVQVDVTESIPSVGILAFKNGSDMTIVLYNENTSAKTINLAAAGGTTLPSSFQVYRTSASEYCAYLGATTSLDVTVPAQSITTLYSKASEPTVQWAPNSPANVAATNITETAARITWSMPADWTMKALPADYTIKTNGYYVYRKETNGTYTKLTPTSITNLYFQTSGLKSGTTYTYAVVSRDDLYNLSAFAEVTFKTACTVGVDCPDALPETKIDFSVFPNPAHDLIRIKLPSAGFGSELQICSSAGEIVKSMPVTSSEFSIDLMDMPSGLYIIRYISKDGSGSQTIIKQ